MITLDGVMQAPGGPGEDTSGGFKYGGWTASYGDELFGKIMAEELKPADYILGRNATGYCSITGAGSKSPMHPHHRPSVADGIVDPVPGLMVGGPNPAMQDHCHYEFTEPETAYSDNSCAYASNEIAINWNAPAVYVLNAFEALRIKLGYVRNY